MREMASAQPARRGRGTWAPVTQRWIILAFSLILFTCLIRASSPAERGSPREVVDQLQKRYQDIESFRADFEQVFQSRTVDMRESGIVMMKKPGKMYWEYEEPTKKFFVADGKKAYFYVPRNRQVLVSDLQLEGASAPLLFLLGKGNIEHDFQVQWEREEEPSKTGNLKLRLTPRVAQGEFAYLFLEVNPINYRIERLSVIEPIGNRNDYILSNVQENIKIPDRQFKLDLPSDVEVIQQ